MAAMLLAPAWVLGETAPTAGGGAGPTAAGAQAGSYVPIPWLVVLVVLLFVYLGTAAWVDREAHHLRMKFEQWNLMFVGLIAGQAVLFVLVPVFISVPLGLVAYVVLLHGFARSRNAKVIQRDKVFTREHAEVMWRQLLGKLGLRSTREERLASALGEHVPVSLTDGTGKLVSASERMDRDEVVQKLKDVLAQAQKERAREVHLAPGGAGVRVLFCVDGMLYPSGELERGLGNAMVAKVRSLVGKLGVVEEPEEEQPRFAMDFPLSRRRVLGAVYEVVTEGRAGTAVRLMDQAHRTPGLEQLGMTAGMLAEVRRLADSNNGMIVLAGARGSGYRTTMYAVLESMDAFTRNLGAVELSPPRRKMPNIVQERVGGKTGEQVREVLGGMFKQDFNVVMVEGIRDAETMRFCVEGSRKDHVMVMGLEAPEAGTVVEGLLKLGKGEALADGLRLVVSQRLVRVLCPQCRRAVEPEEDLKGKLTAAVGGGSATVYEEVGCPACGNTGFAGRTGIFEFLPVKGAVRAAIAGGKTAAEVMNAGGAEGYVGLRQSAMEKVARGLTSVKEANRVLSGK